MAWVTRHYELSGGALISALVAFGLSRTSISAIAPVSAALLAYLCVALILSAKLSDRRSIGWPNRITLIRAASTCALAGLLLQPDVFHEQAWPIVALVLVVLSLDGVDGWLARHLDERSRFGARFDMETDAALIVVLCAGVWLSGLASAWVLAIGLMRPVFVAAGRALPWLTRELPESFRRKLICVVQVAALPLALLPFVDASFRIGVLAVALLALTYSFAVDIAWLFHHRHGRIDNAWRTT